MRVNTTKSVFIELPKEDHEPNIACIDMELLLLDKYSVLIQVRACGLARLPDYGKTFQQLLTRNLKLERIGAGSDVAGIVVKTGEEVTSVVEGDHVVGLIPLDYDQSGCSDYVVLKEFDVCLKPTSVSFVDAAGCLDDAVKAYVALNYLGKLVPGNTVLVLSGATSYGSLCIQLAQRWRSKVIATCASVDERRYLQTLGLDAAQIIALDDQTASLKSAVMLETGNLGVDVVVDQGVQQFKNCDQSSDDAAARSLPSKHDVISCLAVGGRWITSSADLQLDPPNTAQLMSRCASVCFLFEQAWLLSGGQQGRYQHVLRDILDKLANKTIRPNVHHTVAFDGVTEALKSPDQPKVGRVVMTNRP